jgi:hypothetical protein
MSHHYSGPDWGFSHGDARLDLTYPYAFPKPGDAGKSILIMNVHPSVRDSTARTRSGAPPSTPSHPRHCTSLRLTRTATASPISRTGCASFPQREGRRPRRCAALKAQAARTDGDGQTIVEGAPVSTAGSTGDGGRRLPLLRGLAQ